MKCIIIMEQKHYSQNYNTNLSINKYNDISNKEVIEWLNIPIDDNLIISDYILDLYQNLVSQLQNNDLTLRQDKSTFMMNFIIFVYKYSNTKINI